MIGVNSCFEGVVVMAVEAHYFSVFRLPVAGLEAQLVEVASAKLLLEAIGAIILTIRQSHPGRLAIWF